MLTLFAIPKPFRGQSDLIQRNAIASWTRIDPRPEVVLFGDEEGTAEFAQQLGVRHIPEVARNEFGTPRLDDLFARAERAATTPLLAYVNADIILSDEFPAAVARVQAALGRFLMVGQRWDLELDAPLDFSAPDWQGTLADRARRANALQPPTCIDYFAFTRGFAEGLPALAIGRTAWDNYLIWRAYSLGFSVVDATRVVHIVHQVHDYSHHPGGARAVWTGPEARRNRELTGGWWHRYTIEDAAYILTPSAMRRSYQHPWMMAQRLWSHPLTVFTWPWQVLRRSLGA
jgi:hypothetical protein